MPNVSQALLDLQSHGLERLDAQLLVLHALGKSAHERGWLPAHDTELIDHAALQALSRLVKRRLAGEPLAYITGHREFFGLDLALDPRVLIPRPETETLVEWALEVLKLRPPGFVLDLGTGSGAIALALKHTRPDLQILAVDASHAALRVARANAQRLQLDLTFQHGNWFEGIADQFQVIVSNPPYVGAQDQHLNQLRHEPLQALASGDDGLNDIRQIVRQAPRHLNAGGWLLLEHGYDQAARVRELLHGAGFEQVQSRRDLGGIERCSGGCTATTPAACPGFQ